MDGTLEIIRLAARGKPKHLNYISTLSVYPFAPLLIFFFWHPSLTSRIHSLFFEIVCDFKRFPYTSQVSEDRELYRNGITLLSGYGYHFLSFRYLFLFFLLSSPLPLSFCHIFVYIYYTVNRSGWQSASVWNHVQEAYRLPFIDLAQLQVLFYFNVNIIKIYILKYI